MKAENKERNHLPEEQAREAGFVPAEQEERRNTSAGGAEPPFLPVQSKEASSAQEAQRDFEAEVQASYEKMMASFSYAEEEDRAKAERAFHFARLAHRNQRRATGEPYILHPLAVSQILLELKPDVDALCAALLHDTVEDTGITLYELTDAFGEGVAQLVDGVTKLEKMSYSSREELQAENYRKMFLAMAKDIRVVLIKLSDRLHNMRTMKHLPRYKQEKISQETLDIYAPLAERLGVYRWKWELEDLCLRYLDRSAYYELVGAISQKRVEREAYLNQIVSEIAQALEKMGIQAEVEGRPKHFYSVYRKMTQKNKLLDQIYDLFACRVLVKTVGDCYSALGQVHEMYRPMPGRFKDYIAVPKANHYQSLHTTVFGPQGYPFEVQIRTFDMHQTAEFGIAAHWKYKQGITDPKKASAIDVNMHWLDQMLEWQKELKDSAAQYIAGIKGGLESDEVYVFTPRGDVYSLPKGSVAIDLAYAIHSGLGNRMYGARVNGSQAPQDYQLETGDIVEILTSDKVNGPSYDWLKIVKSQGARTKINQWFKKERREENVLRGQQMLEKEISRSGFTSLQLIKSEYMKPILKRFSLRSEEDLFAAIGNGTSGLTAGRIAPKLRDGYLKSLSQEEREALGYYLNAAGQFVYRPEITAMRESLENSKSGSEVELGKQKSTHASKHDLGIEVKGIDNCLVRLSRCCSPMPGDAIIGYITVGRGVAIHRQDCPNIRNIMKSAASKREEAERAARLIEARWSVSPSREKSHYQVSLNITAHDRRNLFADVSNAISEERVSILSGKFNSFKDVSAMLTITIEVHSQEQYSRLVGRLRAIPDVIDVKRA